MVVYDRGYYSFELLCAHRERGLHAVFRIRRKAGKALDRFIDSKKTDTVSAILPGRDALRELSRKHPGKRWRPLPPRLVKYTRGATEYVVGTTLLDSRRYRVARPGRPVPCQVGHRRIVQRSASSSWRSSSSTAVASAW